MVAPAVEGIDLFKIAGRSISGWIPSLKTGITVRQPFCSQLEERLMLWLEYHPLVVNYARGDIDPQFATKYRLPIPKHAPFAIGYTFEDKPHHYLPDAVGTLTNGNPFIAEAGMEDDKRGDRNLAKAEAARRLARFQQGTFWIGTERTLTKRRHYNLVFLHARRKTFPAFGDIAEALASVWPWGEMAEVAEIDGKRSRKMSSRTRRKRWKRRKSRCKRAHHPNARFLERWSPSISNDLRTAALHRWNVLTVEERVRSLQSRASSGSLRTSHAKCRPR
jgi:hypothetical protein